MKCMIKQIKFVSIACEDQDRAMKFYTEKLGLLVGTDQPFNAQQRWIELLIPGAETGIVLFTMEGQKPGGMVNISLATNNVEETYRELSARGVEFVQPPTKQEWGNFAMMVDSEGNRLVISSRS